MLRRFWIEGWRIDVAGWDGLVKVGNVVSRNVNMNKRL